MYVQPGTRLYSIADLSTVWVYAEIFQSDIGRVKVGDLATVTVDSYLGQTFPVRVSFIWPAVDQTTRTARVRLEIHNSEMKLSLGMFVNVLLGSPMGRQLVIPASGVFQSGTRQIAFVDHGEGYFEPRDIEVGARAGNDVIVLKGLEAGERIATSANFLIDSESQAQAALGSITPPPPGAGAAASMNAPQGQMTLEYSSNPSTPRAGSNVFRIKLTGAGGAIDRSWKRWFAWYPVLCGTARNIRGRAWLEIVEYRSIGSDIFELPSPAYKFTYRFLDDPLDATLPHRGGP
jgi:membrane fusion protein, copper/silver efflux system